jgi:hypothetical protein
MPWFWFIGLSFFGTAIIIRAATYHGWYLFAWIGQGVCFWVLSVIVGLRENAAATERANEAFALRNAFPPKVMLPKPDGGMVMLAESKTSIRWTFLEGIDDKLLIEIADDWARGGKFSEVAWRGRLSAGRFRELQDLFLKREILAWKNTDHRQGVEWTAAGRGLLRRARADLPAPLKRLVDVQQA